MVIGNGMIAKAFYHYKNNDDVLIFASGVANSKENDDREFTRELQALNHAIQNNNDKLIVYFSTCSILDKEASNSPYVLHKLNMEHHISSLHSHYLIFRLPQVIGRSQNRTTLVNYLYDKIINNEPFTIWQNAIRYLIDVEDVAKIVSHVIERKTFKNKILNIAAMPCFVPDLVKHIEKITKKQASYSLEAKGSPFTIDSDETLRIAQDLNILCDDNYLERVLSKYYSTNEN
jgi:nucleoside-diphosphate-sugar epimerase